MKEEKMREEKIKRKTRRDSGLKGSRQEEDE